MERRNPGTSPVSHSSRWIWWTRRINFILEVQKNNLFTIILNISTLFFAFWLYWCNKIKNIPFDLVWLYSQQKCIYWIHLQNIMTQVIVPSQWRLLFFIFLAVYSIIYFRKLDLNLKLTLIYIFELTFMWLVITDWALNAKGAHIKVFANKNELSPAVTLCIYSHKTL